MNAPEKLHVTIGKVRVGGPGQCLTAILGSCVGIGFLFSQRRIYGLAHCLLAKSAGEDTQISGRHVDSAIRSLSSMMNLTPGDHRKVRVVLAGGANMTRPNDANPNTLVGKSNATFALKAVKEAGFRIQHDELGGNLGRQISIDCDTGNYTILEIPRLEGAR